MGFVEPSHKFKELFFLVESISRNFERTGSEFNSESLYNFIISILVMGNDIGGIWETSLMKYLTLIRR